MADIDPVDIAVDVGKEEKKKKKKDRGDDGDLPADSRVRVAVRVRPFNRADHGDQSLCLTVDNEVNKITADNGQKNAAFTFDHVFFEKTQQEVSQACFIPACMVLLLRGRSCPECSSTHTCSRPQIMQSPVGTAGIVCAEAMFDRVKQVRVT